MSCVIVIFVPIMGTRRHQKQNLFPLHSNAGDFVCSQCFACFSNTIEYKYLEASYLVAQFITKI